MPRALSERTFDELAADLEKRPDSLPYLQASAELHIRQIKALLEATEAQKAAANAEELAADAAQRNAKYLLWSVIVAAISAIASMLSAIFAYMSATQLS